ncbi:MAG: metal-dependent transcriptional regulator [Candidatus Poseidoniia archaeon]|nr:metal-dependent transcriptional regulator [Candidatus Poseidoniia archaeon]
MASVAVENYLKSMWELGPAAVATQELAQHLAVAPASATRMLQRLSERGLVAHTPYRGASLTAAGERRALSVVRRHRLLETFLARTLDLGRDQLHDEAERLEHALSPALERAIDDYLGNPQRDPHGHPIPGPQGELPPEGDSPLGEWPLDRPATVSQVPDRDGEMLGWLESQGLVPGRELRLVARDPFDGGVTVKLDGRLLQVAASVAEEVRVSDGGAA